MSPLPQWGSGNLALRLSGGKPESLPLPPVNREAQALARLAQTMAELRDEMHMMRRDMTALGTRMKARYERVAPPSHPESDTRGCLANSICPAKRMPWSESRTRARTRTRTSSCLCTASSRATPSKDSP